MKQQIPAGQEAIGHIVAFYDRGSLHLGLVSAFEAPNYRVLLPDEHIVIVNASRITLCSKDSYDLHVATLADFTMHVNAQGLPEITIDAEGLNLIDIANNMHLGDDYQIFALLMHLKANPQRYLQKHDLYFQRSPESEAGYLQEKEKQEARRLYLEDVLEVAKHPNSCVEAGLRATLLQDLRLLLQNERIDDLSKTLKNAGNINPASLREALGDTLALSDPPLLDSGVPIVFLNEELNDPLLRPKPAVNPVTAFCIDDEDSRDFDDAISLESMNDGFLLGIHVSNLADFIDRYHPLFAEAKARVSSLYLPSGLVAMLPPKYSEQLFSLRAGEEKPVLSLFARFDLDFNLLESRFESGYIRVSHNYCYKEVDKARHHEAWQPLFRIANDFFAQRGIAEKNDGQRYAYKLTAEGKEMRFKQIDLYSPARRMIEELMIFYNRQLADFALKHRVPVLFRNITQFFDEEKQWQNSTAFLDTSAGHHPGIGAEAYLHGSSPIRRFVDMLNQMQVVEYLRRGSYAFSDRELEHFIPPIERRLLLLRETAQRSERYWMLRYIEQKLLHCPLEGSLKGVINGKYRVELQPWRKQILLALDAIPQEDAFNFVAYDIDWDKMLLKADLIC